jgi:hypothetical protein
MDHTATRGEAARRHPRHRVASRRPQTAASRPEQREQAGRTGGVTMVSQLVDDLMAGQ